MRALAVLAAEGPAGAEQAEVHLARTDARRHDQGQPPEEPGTGPEHAPKRTEHCSVSSCEAILPQLCAAAGSSVHVAEDVFGRFPIDRRPVAPSSLRTGPASCAGRWPLQDRQGRTEERLPPLRSRRDVLCPERRAATEAGACHGEDVPAFTPSAAATPERRGRWRGGRIPGTTTPRPKPGRSEVTAAYP
jgi:hypothetical protein